jgi:hypothetical protein
LKLFYSYSSVDEPFRSELEDHLSLLKRDGFLESWSFRDINAGSDWEREIDDRLARADIVLLLVSASFIASRYCWEIELTRALERASRGEMMLVPVIIRPCDWQTAPFARFQALPDDAKPVTSWRPRDKAWANVAAALRRLIDANKRIAGSSTSTRDSASDVRQVTDPRREISSAIGHTERIHKRAARQRHEGRMNLLIELPSLYEKVAELIRHIRQDKP